MKLLLRRGERKGTFGKLVFALTVRADITPEEKALIEKHKFGPSILYSRKGRPTGDPTTLAGVGSILLHHALDMTVCVADLTYGRTIECKDIVEMLAAEASIREAAKTFAAILHAASQFEGEEVVEL